jgi:hypothetical protein
MAGRRDCKLDESSHSGPTQLTVAVIASGAVGRSATPRSSRLSRGGAELLDAEETRSREFNEGTGTLMRGQERLGRGVFTAG